LVVGQKTHFATHVTHLNNYEPVLEGKLTVSLIVGENGIRQTVEVPSSPGIFNPVLIPKVSGNGQLIFEIMLPDGSEKIYFEDIPVYEKQDDIPFLDKGDKTTDGIIEFLKEQAWQIDFQVQKTRQVPLSEVINTTGEILPRHGDEQVVSAPSSGIIVFANQRLTPGTLVKKGTHLFTLVATGDPEKNLEAKLEQAKARMKKMEAEFFRKRLLVEQEAVSQKAYEEAELQYNLAKVSLNNFTQYLSEGGRKVLATKGGYLKHIGVEPGDFVETGTSVLTITQNRKLQLVANLPQQHFAKIGQIKAADFRTMYHDSLLSLHQFNGKLISYGQNISREDPFIPVYFELDNKGSLLPGSFVELFLHIGVSREAICIPRSAIIEEYGTYSVFVQLDGESYKKRVVKPGFDNGEIIEILEGLNEGEIVVTEGAYQVKMASMSSSIPAHGHTH
jgi:RND family efflux transporter MFP subunit